jgi:hypothetical protein
LRSETNERSRLSDPSPVKIFVRDEMPARRHSRYRRQINPVRSDLALLRSV